MNAVEIIISVCIGVVIAVIVMLVMIFCYALGYRNCARDALKEMDKLESNG